MSLFRSGLCSGAVACAAAITLPAATAAAHSSAGCRASRAPAGVPALSVSAVRPHRVTGSVLLAAGARRVTLATSGAARSRRARHTPPGRTSIQFCLHAGHVARSVTLVKVAPGGVSVALTRRHALTIRHAARNRTVSRTVAAPRHAALVRVLLERRARRAAVVIARRRRASVPARIPARARVHLTSRSGRSVTAPITVSGAPTSRAAAAPARRATPPAARAAHPVTAPGNGAPTPAATARPPAATARPPAATARPPAATPSPPATSKTTTGTTPPPTTTGTTPPPVPPLSSTLGLTPAQASVVPSSPFSATSFWNAALPGDAPIDPNSQTYVGDLLSQISQYGLWMNTKSYSTPVYVVPASQPTVKVTLGTWGPDLQQQFDAVPIPAGAIAAAGTDQHMTVWQPSTDKLWEFWQMRLVNGAWNARWGGEMDNLSSSPGYFQHSGQTTNWGATATGLPLLGGLITMADYQRGFINHAIAIAVPQTRAGVFSWPAQRTDGRSTAATALPEGVRFRLNPDLDIDSLHLTYLDYLIAKAMQTYGIVVRDTSGCVCFYAQDPTPTGTNPWAAPFDGWDEGKFLSWIPWNQLEALQTQLKG